MKNTIYYSFFLSRLLTSYELFIVHYRFRLRTATQIFATIIDI